MIFQSITINNMFSYYGDNTFDLPAPRDDRNIYLIHGKNGFGKTSFLNSIRLLFAKDTSQAIRAINNKMFGTNRLLFGDNKTWQGLINSDAAIAGVKTCFVEACWSEAALEIKARRTWCPEDGSTGMLTIHINNQPLESYQETEGITDGSNAESFLSSRLTPDLIPYFFFDGEEISKLAEATSKDQTEKVEILLKLSLLDRLVAELDTIRREFLSEVNKGDRQEKRAKLILEIEKLKMNIARIDETHKHDKTRTKTIKMKLARLKASADQEQEKKISNRAELEKNKEEVNKLHKLLNSAVNEFIHEVIPFTPLINSELATKVLAETKALTSTSSEFQEIFKYIEKKLPEYLIDSLPKIEFTKDWMTNAIAKRTSTFIKNLREDYDMENVKVSPKIDEFQTFEIDFRTEIQTIKRNTLVKSIQTIQDTTTVLNEKRTRVNTLTAEPQAQNHTTNEEELLTAEEEYNALTKREGAYATEKRVFSQELRKKTTALKAIEKDLIRETKAKKTIQTIENLKETYETAKSSQKKKYVGLIKNNINHYYNLLRHSHEQIKEIEINESFIISYIGRDKKVLGRESLSAGTKQMLAVALLWALKEAASQDVPLIIDTPLARLDKGHRENILKKYYRKASKQVIILPTDAEINQDNIEFIKDSIVAEYQLGIKNGTQTSVSKTHEYGKVV